MKLVDGSVHRLPTIGDLIELLSEFDDTDTLKNNNGTRFIRRLIKQGPDFFLHRLFPACTPLDIREIEGFFGRSIPDSYAAFLEYSNGAIIFDSTFYIYGWNMPSDRNGDLRAPSVADETRYYRERTGDRQGICVASVSGYRKKYVVNIDVNGKIVLYNELMDKKVFRSFLECIYAISSMLKMISNEDGLLDSSGMGVEAMMDSFLSHPN